MPDLLHLVYEYRRLLARRDLATMDLSEAGAMRLDALAKLFGTEPGDESYERRRRYARVDVALAATIAVGRQVHEVSIVNLGGGGVRVEPAPPLQPGERTVIRIVASDVGSVYHYPVEASWRAGGGRSAMGMPFVGTPRQVPVV